MAALDLFDLQRERIRLEALSSYSVLTALIMNASLRLYTSVSSPENSDTKQVQKINYLIFLISCATCVLSGTYTTLIFSLIGIYSKTSLGMEKDAAYFQFIEKTTAYRRIGFRFFLVNLFSFLISFVMSIIFKTQSLRTDKQWTPNLIIGAAICMLVVGIFHGADIVHIATKLIYSN